MSNRTIVALYAIVVIAVVFAFVCMGCTRYTYTSNADGTTFTSDRLLTNATVKKLSVSKAPDGTFNLGIDDLTTEERLTEALRIAIDKLPTP